jgi:hypothetical protein
LFAQLTLFLLCLSQRCLPTQALILSSRQYQASWMNLHGKFTDACTVSVHVTSAGFQNSRYTACILHGLKVA